MNIETVLAQFIIKDIENIKNGSFSDNTVAVDLSLINTDTKRFQNRINAFSKESSDRIVKAYKEGNFDWSIFDPITIWFDGAKKQFFVLSGHSRFNAFCTIAKNDLMFSKIPSRLFKGSEQQAINIALNSNVLSTKESDVERANYYRNLRLNGKTKKEIKELCKQNENKNHNFIYNISCLDPRCKVNDYLVNLDIEATNENTENLRTVADWTGLSADKYNLSVSQQNEIFDFLINGGYGTKVGANTFTNKTKFLERLDYCIKKWEREGSDPLKSLNLKNLNVKSPFEIEWEARVAEAQKALNDAEKVLDEKRKEANAMIFDGSLTIDEKIKILTPFEIAVTKAQNEYYRVVKQKDKVKDAASRQQTLFGVDKDSLLVISICEENKKSKSRKQRNTSVLTKKVTVYSSEHAYSQLAGANLKRNFQLSKFLTEKINTINSGLDFFKLLRNEKFVRKCFSESIYIENINDTTIRISQHNQNCSNSKNRNQFKTLSISIVEPNKKNTFKSDKEVESTEFVYKSDDLGSAEYKNIIYSIINYISNGEYIDFNCKYINISPNLLDLENICQKKKTKEESFDSFKEWVKRISKLQNSHYSKRIYVYKDFYFNGLDSKIDDINNSYIKIRNKKIKCTIHFNYQKFNVKDFKDSGDNIIALGKESYSFEEFDILQKNSLQGIGDELWNVIFNNDETIEIVDYSEKAWVITGRTFPFRILFNELKFKFNERLTCGAGWVVSKSRFPDKKEIEKLIDSTDAKRAIAKYILEKINFLKLKINE